MLADFLKGSDLSDVEAGVGEDHEHDILFCPRGVKVTVNREFLKFESNDTGYPNGTIHCIILNRKSHGTAYLKVTTHRDQNYIRTIRGALQGAHPLLWVGDFRE
jgi:hypothetical protein